jgi:FkbM family methyltransferase
LPYVNYNDRAFVHRLLRAGVSYVPSASLMPLREMRDLPRRVRRRPHELDFQLLAHLGLVRAKVVDVGANRGQSIRSVRIVLDGPDIVAFEPNPMLASYLHRRFESRGQVTVHPVALGAEKGEFELFLPRYGHTVYDTRASLAAEQPRAFLSSPWFVGFDPTRAHVDSATVQVVPLDAYDLEVDVLKIDVEGAADEAIRGGLETIERCTPFIIVEDPPVVTRERLNSIGYTDFSYDPQDDRLLTGDHATLNTVFLQSDHIDRMRTAGVTVG